ncbi:MAG: heavy metal translocating P-type ATPase [Pseudomonadota bacterium]
MTAACPACAAVPAAVNPSPAPTASVQLSVPSMRCAACIAAIEDHLAGLPSVRAARVNLSGKRVQIETDRPAEEMVQALTAIGYEAFPFDTAVMADQTDPAGRDLLMRLGVAGFAMMNVMLLSVAVWSGAEGATRHLFHLISATIALPTVLYSAQPFFRSARSALSARRLNMDVPISLAIVLAGGMSLFEVLSGGEHAYFDAALSLTFFLLIGRYLDHRTRAAARSAAKDLAALEVHTAERKTPQGYATTRIDDLKPGDTVLVPTGVRVPVDGCLLSAEADSDRSLLTGESDPVHHMKGAELNAGEINLGAPFELITNAVGPDTRLRQIAGMVEAAETARNRYTSLADRAARIYAPAVHLLGLATFIGWMVATQDVRLALNIAISVLIITCPCALGLAVPAVSTAAISKLYSLGFLVKSGTALERLAEVNTIIFDKTGTLTAPGFAFDLKDFRPRELQIAKALSQVSAHPVSKALCLYLTAVEPAELEAVRETKSQGVSGKVDGISVALGRPAWLGQESDGLGLQIGSNYRALSYHETLRPGVRQMTDWLGNLGHRLEIISGDTAQKTAHVAAAAGIAEFQAQMTPEGKSAHIAQRAAQGQSVCMMGDGLNDTVALAGAHASIAPGTALDAARNAADVLVIGKTLKNVPKLFGIATNTVRLSRQNFAIALGYNAVAIPVAVMGYATPLAAALAMSISSITVILNAVRVGRAA